MTWNSLLTDNLGSRQDMKLRRSNSLDKVDEARRIMEKYHVANHVRNVIENEGGKNV